MGIFDKLFKGEKENSGETGKDVPWNELKEISQLDKIEMESEDNYVAILKHSTRCGISRMVLRMFESDYNISEDAPVKLYFLDLIAFREISNEIEKRFNVRHESPQLIILHNKEVVHHSSHQSISAEKLQEMIS